jgi:hypothetical protein
MSEPAGASRGELVPGDLLELDEPERRHDPGLGLAAVASVPSGMRRGAGGRCVPVRRLGWRQVLMAALLRTDDVAEQRAVSAEYVRDHAAELGGVQFGRKHSPSGLRRRE